MFAQSLLSAAGSYQALLAQYGLILIFAAIAIEGIGIPAPGQTLLVAGALLAAHGTFDIRILLALSWLAAASGSLLGFLIGRYGGRALLLRLPIPPPRLRQMDDFTRRYGFLLVVLSRFIDGPRQLTGLFAGSLEMPAGRFVLATAAGATLWIGFWGCGAWYLGEHMRSIDRAHQSLAPWTWIATGLVVLLTGAWLIRKHRGQHRAP